MAVGCGGAVQAVTSGSSGSSSSSSDNDELLWWYNDSIDDSLSIDDSIEGDHEWMVFVFWK